MPTYTYINEDTGEKVELITSIANRDSVPGHKRIEVPDSPPLVTGECALRAMDTPVWDLPQKEQVRRGYLKREEQQGSRFRAGDGKGNYWSKQQIKKAWEI